jgi:hypothetical protein
VVAIVLAVGIGLVASELALERLRRWLAARPVTVAVAVGLIFLVLTVFLVERWLALNESERWRTPAVAALDAYIHSADDVGLQIYSRVYSMVDELPVPAGVVASPRLPWPEPHIADALQRLLEQDRLDSSARVVALSSFMRGQANHLAVTALLATQTIARHEPFAWIIENIAQQQTRLADAARSCNGLDWVGSGFGGAHNTTYRATAAKGMQDIEKGLQAFVDEVHTMRAQLDEVPEERDGGSRIVRWLARHPADRP